MKREVSAVQPFDFRSDFSAPPPADDGTVRLSAEELRALLAETREATAALVRDETLQAEAQRLSEAADALKSALGDVVQLADQLERAGLGDDNRRAARAKIAQIARQLVDGQGDLFASQQARLPLAKDSSQA